MGINKYSKPLIMLQYLMFYQDHSSTAYQQIYQLVIVKVISKYEYACFDYFTRMSKV